MNIDAAGIAPPPPPRRRRRWPWIALAAMLAVITVVLLVLAWIFQTTQGTRFLIDRAASLAGEGLRLEGVQGSLGGPMHIQRIELSRPDMYVLVQDIDLDTAPFSSLRGTLFVHKLAARSMEVRTVDTQATAELPQALAPPYGIRLDEGRVGELRKGTLTKEAGAEKDAARKRSLMDASRGTDVVLHDIFLRGGGDARQWTIDEASVVTAYGKGSVAGRIENKSPFAVDLKAKVEGVASDRPYRADATAKGSLRTLELALDAVVSGQPATARATLEPFSKFPLRALTAHAKGIDLAALAGGPKSRLDVDVQLTGAAQANAFAGPIRIANGAPGRWDQGALPFQGIAARVVVTQERVDVADLSVQLPGGGNASGRATLTKEGVQADLAVADVDLAALHGNLQKTRITGRIQASGDRAHQRFDVALEDPRFAVEGRAGLGDERLAIETVKVTTGGGSVVATGGMALTGRKDFRFEGHAEHFDPAAFVKTTPGDLNFSFVASGAMAPALAGEVRATIAPSRYAGLPAQGRVLLAGDAKRISTADVDVTVGDAHVAAKGAFGATNDAMDVTFKVPNIAAVAKPFGVAAGGSVEGDGQLRGTFQAPAGHIALHAANLVLPSNVAVHDLVAKGEAGVAADSRIALDVTAQGIRYGKENPPPPFAESVTASLQGTRADHRLDVTAVMTKETTAKVGLQGGLDPRAKELAWRGRVTTLAMTGRGAFALQGPASLVASADRVELGDARLKGEWGEAHFETTRWTPRSLDLKGASQGIEIQNLARSLKLDAVPRSNLVVAVDWDVRAAENLNGTVHLKRVSGDLRIGDPPLPLGLRTLELSAQATNGRADAQVRIEGDRTGTLQGEGRGMIARGASGWEFASGAPVQAHLVAQHGNLEALSPWLGVDGKLGGRLEADIRVTGTGANPQVSGQATLADLVAREPQTGFEIERGQVALRLAGNLVTIDKFTASTPWHPVAAARARFTGLQVPASGTFSATGSVDITHRKGSLRLHADHAVVTQLPTRFVAISGDATLESAGDAMQVDGDFKADAGWVGALDTPPPSLAEDVVVVRASAPPVEQPKASGAPIRIDLKFGFGDHVFFAGRGLDTRLAGDLHLTGVVGSELRATGAIRTVGGIYKGYGQNLEIERGVLQFAGPIDNPRLNVLAVRKGLAVEPGVEVLGSATRPRIRLVSTPDVPEPDKLSWLVLGRGPSELAPGDASVLLAAASSMLGGDNPGADFSKRLGLDEVKIGRSDNGSVLGVLPQSTVAGRTGSPSAATVVSVGKRLTRNVNLTYEQGLADAEGALRIAWQLTRQFQLLARAGYLPGLDAVYRWSFK